MSLDRVLLVKSRITAVALLAFVFPILCWFGAATAVPDVRTIYLVPSDRSVRLDYENAVADAFQAMQSGYGGQLGGRTFTLHDPIVEPFVTPHASSFYVMDRGFPSSF